MHTAPSNWHSIRRNWTHCFVTLASADFIRTGNTAFDRGSTSDRPRYHKRYQLVCLSSRNQTSNLKYWRAIFETYAHTKTRSVVSWFNRGSKYQRSSWVGSTPRVGLGWVLGRKRLGWFVGPKFSLCDGLHWVGLKKFDPRTTLVDTNERKKGHDRFVTEIATHEKDDWCITRETSFNAWCKA